MELRIKRERISKKWTQEYVAPKIGATLSTVHKIETGKRKPSYEILCKLEDLFEQSHRCLLEQVDE